MKHVFPQLFSFPLFSYSFININMDSLVEYETITYHKDVDYIPLSGIFLGNILIDEFHNHYLEYKKAKRDMNFFTFRNSSNCRNLLDVVRSFYVNGYFSYKWFSVNTVDCRVWTYKGTLLDEKYNNLISITITNKLLIDRLIRKEITLEEFYTTLKAEDMVVFVRTDFIQDICFKNIKKVFKEFFQKCIENNIDIIVTDNIDKYIYSKNKTVPPIKSIYNLKKYINSEEYKQKIKENLKRVTFDSCIIQMYG